MAPKVKIERHHLKNGMVSLHLSYYPPFYDCRERKTIRSEKLNLQIYAHPKTPAEKEHNRKFEELAMKICTKRTLQVCNEEYGFLDKSRQEEDFLAYYKELARKHDSNSKWDGSYVHFNRFVKGKCTFGMLSVDLMKGFREYLLKEARNRRTGELIHQNTASGYFIAFRSVIKSAFLDHMIDKNYNDYIEGINTLPTDKPYLTQEEFDRLAATPCRHDVLRRAAVFAVFSGLRISDILDLKWEHIVQAPDGGWCIRKIIVKTRRMETVYISDEALEWCGERGTGCVFRGLTRSMSDGAFKKWVKDAGIDKPFTFHCLRHASATLMCGGDIDLYTVSKQLTHRNITTTQIYAGIYDEKLRKAANSITLKK